LTSGPFGPIKECDFCTTLKEFGVVKEILDRIDNALARLNTLKEGL
jgi:hypothetical protein